MPAIFAAAPVEQSEIPGTARLPEVDHASEMYPPLFPRHTGWKRVLPAPRSSTSVKMKHGQFREFFPPGRGELARGRTAQYNPNCRHLARQVGSAMTPGNLAPGCIPPMISRHRLGRFILSALVICFVSMPAGSRAEEAQQHVKGETPKNEGVKKPLAPEGPESVRRGPVPITPPRIAEQPPAGRGRLSITFDGNRRWCTFPDDRLQQPPVKTPTGSKHHRAIYTFGYQFSVAAVDRARPDATLLLYSSPVITTATLRQAGKLGRGTTPGRINNRNPVAVPDDGKRVDPRDRETAATLVPYWDEDQRCAKLAEQFDFDLGPGRYDVYISFDIQISSGPWVHRTYAYLTDIDIAKGSRTLVDGLMETRGGGRRTLQLRSAAIEPLAGQGAARP